METMLGWLPVPSSGCGDEHKVNDDQHDQDDEPVSPRVQLHLLKVEEMQLSENEEQEQVQRSHDVSFATPNDARFMPHPPRGIVPERRAGGPRGTLARALRSVVRCFGGKETALTGPATTR